MGFVYTVECSFFACSAIFFLRLIDWQVFQETSISVYSFSDNFVCGDGILEMVKLVHHNRVQRAAVECKGSATVEMAIIMPLFLLIFLLIVQVVFYFHDKCVLYATAYETAVVGAQKEHQEYDYSESDLEVHFQDRIKGKLIFFSRVDVSVTKGIERLKIHAEAYHRGWKIHTEQSAMLMRTEEYIYYTETENERSLAK